MQQSAEQQVLTHHRDAQSALRDGRLQDAHHSCLALLKIQPDFADAWFICSVIAAHNGQRDKAIEILHRALHLAPENPEYHAELGKLLVGSNEPEAAREAADAALALKPTSLPVWNTLGVLFSHLGEHAQALQCFKQAETLLEVRLKENEGHVDDSDANYAADFYFNVATSLQFEGRFEDAAARYKRAIELQPEFFRAHSALCALETQTPDTHRLETLFALRTKVSTPRDQLHLGHAIAKVHEDLGRYDEALQALQWAKAPQRESTGYTPDQDITLFNAAKQAFATPHTAQNIGCNSQEPIFVVGMPRTGTTLVEQILGAHSAVFAAGELQAMPLQVKRLAQTDSPDILDATTLMQAASLNRETLGLAYLDSTRPRTGHTTHFTDKLPINFMYIGLIREALPKAKIICLRRDPMDSCLSNYRQLFAVNFKHYYYNYDLLDCGRYYQQFDQLMAHWDQQWPGAIHSLHYERLVQDPEAETRALLDFCELKWEAQCLRFDQQQSSVATPSAVQVRQGIYASSVNRWQRYGDALMPLYEMLRSAGYYQ